jgi:hypothetical protein
VTARKELALTPDQEVETRTLYMRALSYMKNAPDNDPDYYCAHCGEHSDGDILEAYLPEPHPDYVTHWVAALHVDTCRPLYPWLLTDNDA